MASIIKSNTYADFNGREILTADSNGNLTTQKTLYPAFSAYLTADQSVADSTVAKVNLDAELFDTDSAFDISNSRFTVPAGKAGKYVFQSAVSYVNLTNEDQGQARIHKNGTVQVYVNGYQGQNGSITYQCVETIDLDVGDYIEIYAYQVSGGAISVDGGSAYLTYLKGFRVGS